MQQGDSYSTAPRGHGSFLGPLLVRGELAWSKIGERLFQNSTREGAWEAAGAS